MIAPFAWRTVDFLSDVHLDPSELATFGAWSHHLRTTPADAIFILGDLFEVWVGDDSQDPFSLQCMDTLRVTAQRVPVFFMCGNRDFLVGAQWLKATGVQPLDDPTVLKLGTHNLLLSHGDALCTGDTEYMAFRAKVRSSAWQYAFLDKPLVQRQTIAKELRAQSKARQQAQTTYVDVDKDTARAWLIEHSCERLVHGHTHQPAWHDLGDGLSRHVLSDWEADAAPPRLEVLRWSHDTQALDRVKL